MGTVSTTVVTTSSEPEATSSEPEAEPESEPEVETSSMPPVLPSVCGSCTGCMWSHGQCYMDAEKSYCETWSDNTWCGASLAQVKRHEPKFLGSSFIQDRVWVARDIIDDLYI